MENLVPQIHRACTEVLGSHGAWSHYNPGHTLPTLGHPTHFPPDPSFTPYIDSVLKAIFPLRVHTMIPRGFTMKGLAALGKRRKLSMWDQEWGFMLLLELSERCVWGTSVSRPFGSLASGGVLGGGPLSLSQTSTCRKHKLYLSLEQLDIHKQNFM